jgi:hypothetical protein
MMRKGWWVEYLNPSQKNYLIIADLRVLNAEPVLWLQTKTNTIMVFIILRKWAGFIFDSISIMKNPNYSGGTH